MQSRKFRWVHIVPLVHLLVCVAIFSGYVVLALQPLGILASVLLLVDLPISLVYGALAFGGHEALAAACLVLGGTAWWYLLCRVSEKIAATPREVARAKAGADN